MTTRPQTIAQDKLFHTEHLKRDMETLLAHGPRSIQDPVALARTIEFISDTLSAYGYVVRIERFEDGPGDCNIIAEKTGADPMAAVLEIGAHFDTVEGTPGADDNGSGIVGLLAVAGHFAQQALRRTVRFCFFGREETGLLGSEAHQRELDKQKQPFAGCIVFEMIGCCNREPNSQGTPARIPFLLWPPRTGDFLALVANRPSRALATLYENSFQLHAAGLGLFPIKSIGGLLKDAMRSDHASYWRAKRPAIMLTDTANFRNPHYHAPTDTVDTIDFDFLAAIARTTAAMAADWAR